MNFFELINAILLQLDLPVLDEFNNAKLPVHKKIKDFINKANKQIITYNDWNFKKKINGENGEFVAVDGIVEQDIFVNNSATNSPETPFQNFAKDEFGTFKQNLENETDTSILPEPFGSELIVCHVCTEINQEPNNPKYAHWRQKYNTAFAQLNANFRQKDTTVKFKLKRG